MPVLRLVEVIHYVTDTVEEQQRDKHQKHHISSPDTDVHCSISAKLCMMLEEIRAIISPSMFLGSINSLAARGKKRKISSSTRE